MKPSDLLKEVGATPPQPQDDPVMSFSPGAEGPSSNWLPPNIPMNDTEYVSQGPAQQSNVSKLKQQGLSTLKGAGGAATKAGGAIAKGVGSIAKGAGAGLMKGLDAFERGRQGAIQGWTASSQAHAGQEQAGRIAQEFINRWNRSIGQDPSLNNAGYLMSFAEKIAPQIPEEDIPIPTDMSAVGVAKYLRDIVAKDLAAEELYGGETYTPSPDETMRQKAFAQAAQEKELEKARAALNIKASPTELAAAQGGVGKDPVTQEIIQQLQAQQAELQDVEQKVDSLIQRQPVKESHNYSAILWKQMREGK